MIDTILLVGAITLTVKIQQYPFVYAWLPVKTLVLRLYIFCGMVALNYGKTKKQLAVAFMIALISFAYIVLVALSKTPVPV